MTHSTPSIMSDPTSGYYDDDVGVDSGITLAPRPTEMPFQDTMPSMPAPLYMTPVKRKPRRWPRLITAIALVAFCAVLVLFFTR